MVANTVTLYTDILNYTICIQHIKIWKIHTVVHRGIDIFDSLLNPVVSRELAKEPICERADSNTPKDTTYHPPYHACRRWQTSCAWVVHHLNSTHSAERRNLVVFYGALRA